MLDLKAQLLQAGLVSEKQVERASKKRPENKLKGLSKAEQYGIIRRWVDKNRLDREFAEEKFFFEKPDKSVSWLRVSSETLKKIQAGDAGLTAYMSNSGLAHTTLPRDIVEDIIDIFPDWLRVLK
ncbi:MAG: hypothetical protein JKY15_05980 [Deltaproteobacteria bacterium]|nr:hypothetical protein [Deltaproteobacteria bacterium]